MLDDAKKSLLTIQELYFGEAGGWCLATPADWLVREGRRIGDAAKLLDGLVEKLLTVGAPVDRVRFTYRTINPQLFGHTVMWVRGQGTKATTVGHYIEQSDDYIGSPIQTVQKSGVTVRRVLNDLTAADHSVFHSMKDAGVADYLAIPMIFSDGQINVMTIGTYREGGFSETDILKLEALVEHMASIVETMAMRSVTRSLLNTYLGRRTGDRVLSGKVKRGDGEMLDAVVWFSDLRDFTPLTETLPPKEMLAMLNMYFETVDNAVSSHGGEILRFIGDAMLIVFPTNEFKSVANACRAAIFASIDAFNSMATVNLMRRRHKEPEIRFGVGLHVGEVVYGNVGGRDRLDFTVMGPAVNRTARLEGLTKTLGHSLLISKDLVDQADISVVDLGLHAMKGVAEPQPVFALNDMNDPYNGKPTASEA